MSSADPEPLTPDEVFEILSNHRRRMVLYYLRQHGQTATVNELAEEIAAMENEIPVEELTSQQRKRVYVSLYQTHLPKMAEANVIDYDTDAGTVSLANRTNNVDRYLTAGQDSTYPWNLHYVALAVLGSAFMLLSLVDAPLVGAVPLLWVGVGTVALLVVSAVVQYWYYRRRQAEIPVELTEYDR